MDGDNDVEYVVVNKDTAYEDIANAIIRQAAHDYRIALATHNQLKIESLERFFKSERYTILSTISGEFIMSKIKDEVLGKNNKNK
jgi:hypothetical protein